MHIYVVRCKEKERMKLNELVLEAWNNRQGAVVFSTVDGNGMPNAIYATCVGMYDSSDIVVADNYFDKTRKNIQAGTRGSVLFITEEGKAFQAKGTVEYHKDGVVFEDMKKWNPEQHPGHAAAALKVESVYSGSEKIQ